MEGETIKTICSILFLDVQGRTVFIPKNTILRLETLQWDENFIGMEATNDPIMITSYEGSRVTIYPGEFEMYTEICEAL